MQKKIQIGLFRFCLLTLAVSSRLYTYAQEPIDFIKNRFIAYQQQTLQEKLYVHTDKDFYLAGEICWFKIYNVDAFFNKPLGISKLAYVEVLDKNNKPVLQAKLPLKKSDANGSFLLPASLGSGKYLFRAYTRWMKNFSAAYFFEKQITVVSPGPADKATVQQKKKYDIQFFPEGGNLVNGIQAKIAFRVADEEGHGLSCGGVIVTDKADTVATFHTLQFGMGNFSLLPENGRHYTAVIGLPGGEQRTLPLPDAYNGGYAMHLEKTGNGQLKITVSSSNPPAAHVYLFVHTRGLLKAAMEATLQNGVAFFLIDTVKLGEGISHCTVFNADRQPVCERLFFRRPAGVLGIKARTDLPGYAARQKVIVQISSTGAGGQPAPADMSLAVYRIDSLTGVDDMDISSYCWLGSELNGPIESPGYYLTSNTPEAEAATDNLVLTQGWRRFRWNDVLQEQHPVFEFAPEYKGHIITGRVVNNADGQPARGVESFLSVAGTRTQFRGTTSNDSGLIRFEMDNFYGNDEIIVQTNGQENGARHVEIANPFSDRYSGNRLAALSLSEENAALLAGRYTAMQVQHAYGEKRLNQLLSPGIDTTPFYFKPDKAYLLDDYVRFTTVEEILREYVPEVNVRKRDGKFFLPVFDNIRKEFFKVDPLILLDGVPVLDADKIMSYDPLKITKLEVMARMYFYGSMFFDGIVNFTTYNGNMPGYELDPHAIVIDYGTLQLKREFFSPQYESTEQRNSRLPDFRNLLYWSPSVATAADGKTSVSFYTSDVPGRFAIVVQGLDANGKTGAHTAYFNVTADK